MKKRLLTLDDLYSFFSSSNKSFNFSSSENGYNIAIQIPAMFEIIDDDETDETEEGLYPTKLKVCHTGVNRNKSRISKKSMEAALPSLHYRPVLGDITTLSDGTKDFTNHAMEWDEEGNITYIEKPIGVFTDPESYHLEYDEEKDRYYVIAKAVIYEEYSPDAIEIIERKNGTKVSCELSISQLSYDAKEKVLDLEKFHFNGVTCLGVDPITEEPIEEGMEGSRLDISDFAEEKNSLFAYGKMIEAMERFNKTLSNLNKFLEEGGDKKLKLEELLKQYGVSKDELTFEVEGLTDEELVQKFEDEFKKKQGSGDDDSTVVEEPEDPDDGDDGEDGEDGGEPDEPEEGEEETPEPEVSESGETGSEEVTMTLHNEISKDSMKRTFEISHEDIRYALYSLLGTYEDADNEWYWINSVYDDYFMYSNWDETKIYKQKYAKDGDNVSFVEERTELFKEYLTASEKANLEEMRSNYAALQQKVSDYEAEMTREDKNKILADEVYAEISDDKDFAALKENVDKYSVQEVQDKADLLLAKHVKEEAGKFSYSKKPSKVGINFSNKGRKKSPYGTLFAKE